MTRSHYFHYLLFFSRNKNRNKFILYPFNEKLYGFAYLFINTKISLVPFIQYLFCKVWNGFQKIHNYELRPSRQKNRRNEKSIKIKIHHAIFYSLFFSIVKPFLFGIERIFVIKYNNINIYLINVITKKLLKIKK